MADLQPTDADRIATLEQQVQALLKRVTALEAKQPATEPNDSNYLQTQIFGAVEGSKQAESLERFQ